MRRKNPRKIAVSHFKGTAKKACVVTVFSKLTGTAGVCTNSVTARNIRALPVVLVKSFWMGAYEGRDYAGMIIQGWRRAGTGGCAHA